MIPLHSLSKYKSKSSVNLDREENAFDTCTATSVASIPKLRFEDAALNLTNFTDFGHTAKIRAAVGSKYRGKQDGIVAR